jgi:muramidase (phage lysozyme)
VDRDKLALVAAGAVLLGGGWWLWRRRPHLGADAGGQLAEPLMEVEAPFLARAFAPFSEAFDAVRDAAGEVVSGVTRAIDDANVAAFLSMIKAAEGTAGANEYYTLFGGHSTLELDTHPEVRTYGDWTAAPGLEYTTAAGAYQITATTWKRLAAKLGLADFSPETQDRMAVELLREAGALELVKAGRFDDAVAKVAPVWASLPGSPHAAKQKTRSRDFVLQAYEGAGGAVA